MKHNIFKRLPLSLAVGALLVNAPSWAETTTTHPTAQLGYLTVSADRQGAKVQTNVVTTDNKDKSTDTDLRGLLQQEPSVDFGGGNGTSQFVYIRGMGHNSIDFKVDNTYSDAQIHYHQGRFMLDPALVKIVSVQKGAGSASAGIGATNGAIVAKTVDANDLLRHSNKDWGVKVGGGFASNTKGISYNIAGFGRTDNFDFLIIHNTVNEKNYHPGKGFSTTIRKAGVAKHTDPNKAPNPADYDTVSFVPASALDKSSNLIKFGLNADNHRIVLSHFKELHKGDRTVREEFLYDDLPKPQNNGTKTTYAAGLSVDRQQPAYRKTSQQVTNIEYIGHDLGMFSEITANIYRQKTNRYSADDGSNGYGGNLSEPTNTLIVTKGANLNLDWPLASDLLLKTGLNYRSQENIPNSKLGMPEDSKAEFSKYLPYLVNPTKTDVGIYAEAIKHVGDFTVTAGARYDRFNYQGRYISKATSGSLSPSLAVIWQPSNNFSLNANHSYATRSPRLPDALLSNGPRNMKIAIARGAKAERARNSEIGFNYKNGAFSAYGSYFWQRINNPIVVPQNKHGTGDNATDIMSEHNLAIQLFNNQGHITNQGYELGAAYNANNLTAKVGIADSNPKFYGMQTTITGRRGGVPELKPEFAANIGRTLTTSLSYRLNAYNLELGIRNRSVGKSTQSELAWISQPRVRPAYSLTDLTANWKPLGDDSMNVNFAVNNVFNKLYYSHGQRPASGIVMPGAGRDFRVGINFTY